MTPQNLEALRKAIRHGHVEWRKHVLQRMAERDIPRAAVLEVLLAGECIENYPADKPFPSGLFLGHMGGRAIHAVAALAEEGERVYIITAYEPSLDVFEPDFRTRRKT
ncbi:MAG: DUF4258 domain-containing protein [Verrucomicrobiia bacterium]|jgi:hypothetical protein